MKKDSTVKTKRDFGKTIWKLMVQAEIKTARELADIINRQAGQRVVSANSVGKWLGGKSVPKATSLMFLAKALNVSADLILFDESENPDRTKSLERIVSTLVKAEIEKMPKEDKSSLDSRLSKFLKSKKIPPEDKESILRQIKNLLKLYPNGENNN